MTRNSGLYTVRDLGIPPDQVLRFRITYSLSTRDIVSTSSQTTSSQFAIRAPATSFASSSSSTNSLNPFPTFPPGLGLTPPILPSQPSLNTGVGTGTSLNPNSSFTTSSGQRVPSTECMTCVSECPTTSSSTSTTSTDASTIKACWRKCCNEEEEEDLTDLINALLILNPKTIPVVQSNVAVSERTVFKIPPKPPAYFTLSATSSEREVKKIDMDSWPQWGLYRTMVFDDFFSGLSNALGLSSKEEKAQQEKAEKEAKEAKEKAEREAAEVAQRAQEEKSEKERLKAEKEREKEREKAEKERLKAEKEKEKELEKAEKERLKAEKEKEKELEKAEKERLKAEKDKLKAEKEKENEEKEEKDKDGFNSFIDSFGSVIGSIVNNGSNNNNGSSNNGSGNGNSTGTNTSGSSLGSSSSSTISNLLENLPRATTPMELIVPMPRLNEASPSSSTVRSSTATSRTLFSTTPRSIRTASTSTSASTYVSNFASVKNSLYAGQLENARRVVDTHRRNRIFRQEASQNRAFSTSSELPNNKQTSSFSTLTGSSGLTDLFGTISSITTSSVTSGKSGSPLTLLSDIGSFPALSEISCLNAACYGTCLTIMQDVVGSMKANIDGLGLDGLQMPPLPDIRPPTGLIDISKPPTAYLPQLGDIPSPLSYFPEPTPQMMQSMAPFLAPVMKDMAGDMIYGAKAVSSSLECFNVCKNACDNGQYYDGSQSCKTNGISAECIGAGIDGIVGSGNALKELNPEALTAIQKVEGQLKEGKVGLFNVASDFGKNEQKSGQAMETMDIFSSIISGIGSIAGSNNGNGGSSGNSGSTGSGSSTMNTIDSIASTVNSVVNSMTTTEQVVNVADFKPYTNFDDIFNNMNGSQAQVSGEFLERLVSATNDSLTVMVPVESYRETQTDQIQYIQALPDSTNKSNADDFTRGVSKNVMGDFAVTINALSDNAQKPFLPGNHILGRLYGLQDLADATKKATADVSSGK